MVVAFATVAALGLVALTLVILDVDRWAVAGTAGGVFLFGLALLARGVDLGSALALLVTFDVAVIIIVVLVVLAAEHVILPGVAGAVAGLIVLFGVASIWTGRKLIFAITVLLSTIPVAGITGMGDRPPFPLHLLCRRGDGADGVRRSRRVGTLARPRRDRMDLVRSVRLLERCSRLPAGARRLPSRNGGGCR
jgi:hypothetical protein